MESYRVLGEHVHVCLFLDFHEGAKLKSRLITAAGLDGASGDAERERVNFAFIDASLVRWSSQSIAKLFVLIPLCPC